MVTESAQVVMVAERIQICTGTAVSAVKHKDKNNMTHGFECDSGIHQGFL